MKEAEFVDRRGLDADDQEAIRKRVRAWRARTIIFSIIASTLVALFIGWENDKDQRDRSVKNCVLTQEDRWDRVDSLRESAAASAQQADSVLGNKQPLIYKPAKGDDLAGTLVVGKHPVPAADFSKPPFNKFKDFKALSLANAQQQRLAAARNIARAKKVQKRIENCNKVFPAPSLLP